MDERVADNFVSKDADIEMWAREAGGFQLTVWGGAHIGLAVLSDDDARQLRDWLVANVKD